MNVVNDSSCSWINDLDKRHNIKTLDKDKSCDWLIVGAGYTGLSAARKLSEPVSYTHLRAHETDSYLVCRLLLEKTTISS